MALDDLRCVTHLQMPGALWRFQTEMPSRDDRTASFCSERMKICQSHLSKVYSRSKNLLVTARSGIVVPEVTSSAARGFVVGRSNPEGAEGLSRFEKTKLSPYLNAVSALFEGPSLLKRSQLREAQTLLADRNLRAFSQPNCPQSCSERPLDASVSVPLFFGETITRHDPTTLASERATAGESSGKDWGNGQSTTDNWEESANGDDFVDTFRRTEVSDKHLPSKTALTKVSTGDISSAQSTTLVDRTRGKQAYIDWRLPLGSDICISQDKFQNHDKGQWSGPAHLSNPGPEQTKVPRLVFPQQLDSSHFPQSSSRPHMYRIDGNNMRSRPRLPLDDPQQGALSTISLNRPSQSLRIAPCQRRAIATTSKSVPRSVEEIVEAIQLEAFKGVVQDIRHDLSREKMPVFGSDAPELLAGNELMLNENFAVNGGGDPLLLGNDSQLRLTSTTGGGHSLQDSVRSGSYQLARPTRHATRPQLTANANSQNGAGPLTTSRDLSTRVGGQNMADGLASSRKQFQASGEHSSGQLSITHSKHRTVHKASAGNFQAATGDENSSHIANLSVRSPNTDSFATGTPGTGFSGGHVLGSGNQQTAAMNRRERFAKLIPDNKDKHQKANASSNEQGAFASRLSTKSTKSSSALQTSVSNFFGVASGPSNPAGTLTVQQFHDAICDHSSPDCPDFRRDKLRSQGFRPNVINQEQAGDRQTDAVGEVVDSEVRQDETEEIVNRDEKQYNYEVRTDMRRQEKSSSTLWKFGNMAVCTEDPRKDYLSGEVPPSPLEMADKRTSDVGGVHWSKSGSRKVVNHVCQILKQNKWGKGVIEQLNSMRGLVSSHCVNLILQQKKDPNLSLSFFNWAKGQKNYKHDVFAFTTMINILGRARNLKGVKHLLEDMHETGVEPTVATYNTLILCYGRVESLSESLRVFRIMQEAGSKPDNVTYSILIHLCIKAGYLQEGLKLYQSMREAGVQPDTITYSIVIDSLGKSGNLREARKLFREMRERGHVPNEFTYNSMIDRHAKASKTQRALKFFTEMRLAGFKLNAVVCTTMMGVLGSLGKYDEAESLFSEMQQAGIVADTAAYGLMINIWGNAGNLDKAVSWYGRMLGNLVTPSLSVFGSLVNAHLEANLYEAAQHFLTSMEMWGITGDLKLYTILLRHCTVCEKQEHADAILGIMDRLGHPAHRFLYELLTSKQQDKDAIRSRITSFLEAMENDDQERKEDQESLQGFANGLVDFLHKLQSKTDPGIVWEIALEKELFPASIVRREAPNHWLVDLHSMCVGTALVALPRLLIMLKQCWIDNPTKRVYVVTGWGRRSRVTGSSALKKAVNNVLEATKSPFSLDSTNAGVFVSYGPPFCDWISRPSVLKKLGTLGTQAVVVR